MDKLKSIKIKYQDGTYSDEIPIGVSVENVDYNDTKTLKQVLSLDVTKGTVEERLNKQSNDISSMSATVNNANENASAASTKADAVDARLDNIIVESGTSDAETIAARTNSNTGITYTTLDQRLDAENSEIKEDLSDNRIFLGRDEYTYIRNTRSGITYEPTSDKTRFHVSGTSTAGSFYNLYHNYTKLLDGITAGDKVYVIFNALEHVFSRILFYDSNQNPIITENIEYNRAITVPSNAVGMTVRYYVYTGYSLDVYVNVPIIVNYDKRSLFAPVFGNTPKYISFIDDDTSSDDLVTKYYNACMHNGVKGAYAVITGRYRTGDNSIDLLRTYNYNGFNTILHCERQYQYLNTTSSAFQRPRSIQNYTEAIRDFKNLNLVNPQNALITPFGAYDDKAKAIAKDMGFDLAFSTRYTRYNTTYETDRYALFRCGLSPIAEVSDDTDATARGTMATCKARVDELSSDEDGGWLIITTHFNTWTGETWDETLDANGFPIGYARFNELVQYALSKGLTPISMAEGITWVKKVLEKNEAISN